LRERERKLEFVHYMSPTSDMKRYPLCACFPNSFVYFNVQLGEVTKVIILQILLRVMLQTLERNRVLENASDD